MGLSLTIAEGAHNQRSTAANEPTVGFAKVRKSRLFGLARHGLLNRRCGTADLGPVCSIRTYRGLATAH